MIKGKLRKTAALLAAIAVATGISAVLYADSDHIEDNITINDTILEKSGTEVMSEETTTDAVPEETTANTEPEETAAETEPDETTTDTEPEETTADTVPADTSEAPADAEETTPVSTTNYSGMFVVPTESTAPPIIIILVGPEYIASEDAVKPAEETTALTTTRPVPSEPAVSLPALEFEEEPAVNKYVITDENAPSAEISMSNSELIEAVLDSSEKELLSNGAEIDIILSVEEGENAVSGEDRALIRAAVSDIGLCGGEYSVGRYLEINLLKNVRGEEYGISETFGEITLKIDVPQELMDYSGRFALVRVHNGSVSLLEDLDDAPDTVTVKTDLFSAYAVVYAKDIENGADKALNTANRLDCLNVFLSAVSVAAIICSAAALYASWNKKNKRCNKK